MGSHGRKAVERKARTHSHSTRFPEARSADTRVATAVRPWTAITSKIQVEARSARTSEVFSSTGTSAFVTRNMGHTYTSLFVHAIFSTRQRERVLTPELRPHLYAYVTGIAKRMGVRIIQIGGVEEHLHLLAEIPAKFSVSLVLEKIKTNSSRWINRTRQISREFHWQDGYGAYSVSASAVQAVKRYIQNQEEHHRRVSFQDEVRAFLRKHEIEFDEKYLWSDD